MIQEWSIPKWSILTQRLLGVWRSAIPSAVPCTAPWPERRGTSGSQATGEEAGGATGASKAAALGMHVLTLETLREAERYLNCTKSLYFTYYYYLIYLFTPEYDILCIVLVRVGVENAAMMLKQNRSILERVCDEEPSKDSTAAATVGAQLGYGDDIFTMN